MKKYGKKIAAAGLCVVMTAGLLTGCSVKESDVVATMDGTKLTYGEANFMLRYNQAQTQTYLGGMFGEGQNLFQQDLTGSGQAYGETLKSNILNNLETLTLLEQHMADYNIELTEEETAAIEEAAKKFLEENSKDVLKEMSATQETVSRILTLETIESKMRPAIEADVDTEVTDEEAAQKTIQYAFFSIPETEESESESETEAASEAESESETEAVSEAESETGTDAVSEVASETETEAASETETEAVSEAESETGTEAESETETEAETEESAEKKQVREQVQGIIDAVQGGETLEDAVKAVDEDKSISTYSYGTEDEILNGNLKEAAETLADGEIYASPVESETGFYVVQMVTTFDREATDERKEEIIEERKSELYNSVVEGWAPESFEINNKIWDKVTFDNIISMQTEAQTEAASEAETETEAASEAETETEAASEAESETEEVSETESETETAAGK